MKPRAAVSSFPSLKENGDKLFKHVIDGNNCLARMCLAFLKMHE